MSMRALGRSYLLLTFSFLVFFSFDSFAGEFPFAPNDEWTYGSLCTPDDPHFEKYDYKEQIARCKRRVSRNKKSQIYDKYGVPEKCRSKYTIDHFVPLSMGGTNHFDNLWPEHQNVKATRQDLEWEVYLDLKEGRITQAEAVEQVIQEKIHPPVDEVQMDSCLRVHTFIKGTL